MVYENQRAMKIMSKDERKKCEKYSKEYMKFLEHCKTEWECAKYFKDMLEKAGFVNIDTKNKLVAGDKVYFLNKERALYAAIIGEDDVEKGVNIVGAHIDSPRLDLKPRPLNEKYGIALFKTQYYGGIKKYQWMTIPLAMHGIIYNSKGERLEIVAGEDDDFCFNISDILPHMAREQMTKNANEFIDPEEMQIVIGSIPDENAKTNKVKTQILKLLNKKYGIIEVDFSRSQIEFVPAAKPKYLGFDKGLIGAYGHDDRVCAYATVTAFKELKNVKRTAVMMTVDKEEIGSMGTTGMESQTFDMFMKDIISKSKSKAIIERVYYNSKMLSADVSSCMDISSEAVVDEQNGNKAGYGISIERYTGGRGKSGASEASAKYMSEVMKIFDDNKVAYQFGTIGKIDRGGGGTIAYILANKGVDVVDCGTPVISMHSPFETVSVADAYMTWKAYKSFFEN